MNTRELRFKSVNPPGLMFMSFIMSFIIPLMGNGHSGNLNMHFRQRINE